MGAGAESICLSSDVTYCEGDLLPPETTTAGLEAGGAATDSTRVGSAEEGAGAS